MCDNRQRLVSIQRSGVLVPKLQQTWAVISVQRCSYAGRNSKVIGQVDWLDIVKHVQHGREETCLKDEALCTWDPAEEPELEL